MYPNDYYSKEGPEGMALKPIGTGPYKVTSVEPGKRYRFQKYDGYHSEVQKEKLVLVKLSSEPSLKVTPSSLSCFQEESIGFGK